MEDKEKNKISAEYKNQIEGILSDFKNGKYTLNQTLSQIETTIKEEIYEIKEKIFSNMPRERMTLSAESYPEAYNSAVQHCRNTVERVMSPYHIPIGFWETFK